MTDYLTEHDLRQHHSDPDGAQIRKTHSIPAFWKLEQNFDSQEHPLPNAIVHTKDGSEWGHPGGTNWLAIGNKGSGKTTLALWLAAHLLDRNDETVIWRGDQARSEWLPFKHWTQLYLPSECEIAPVWLSDDVTERGREPADLEAVVDEVYYYDGLADLLGQLDSHEFAVVYPDPLFRGCTEVCRRSSYAQNHIEYTSRVEASDPTEATPLIHWWIALALARVEGVGDLRDWTSLLFDEVADLLPESARADKNQTYEKVDAMRQVIADSRKYRFSVYCFGHDEVNIHERIRRTFDWRVAMPDDNGNPCRRENDTAPLGFSKIPMVMNFLATRGPGYGVCWTPSNFTRFVWEDVADFEEDADRNLKIEIEPAPGGGAEPAESPPHARATESESDTGGVADD